MLPKGRDGCPWAPGTGYCAPREGKGTPVLPYSWSVTEAGKRVWLAVPSGALTGLLLRDELQTAIFHLLDFTP